MRSSTIRLSVRLQKISSQAKQRLLWYEGSYLTVRKEMHDIIQKPRSTISKLENAVMHIGCLVSDDRFSRLCSVEDVRVNFRFRWQKLEFFLSYHGFEYKLELVYQSIRQIQLHHQCGQATKFLLIQVCYWQRETSFMNFISFIWISFYLYSERKKPM
ncbi:putative RNA-dependent RNA polymerase 1 isoform X1 [Cinnamomum micranthum f. kanehirae]|uniref:Putative RNA-dependent RNA polymerase 1 isoform X1 n=1 Tax=Cinnamomum micranthum f. kanehirae TaxID=337451 RepID=A0A443NM38_9MAGN|nr:putative RNA-dependent RNA polymerase 1 isoform X1 [Cinnamomum micranthum f. kanehirae]